MNFDREIKKPISVWIAHLVIWALMTLFMTGTVLNVVKVFTDGIVPFVQVGLVVAASVIFVCWVLHRLICERRTIGRPILAMTGILISLFVFVSDHQSRSSAYRLTGDVIAYSILIFGVGTSLAIGLGAKSEAYFSK